MGGAVIGCSHFLCTYIEHTEYNNIGKVMRFVPIAFFLLYLPSFVNYIANEGIFVLIMIS
ncbi:hypothetical protein CLORY_23840 [Clostridium oryzae]|uniref:Uncharacterized protein n=1 Tax=Clostridium oryzae TaxID=1450648 RepID=A0A1V4IMB5_9CLOT|nr:hypothetical protein CLORY_23840 [Clostridium oryzae]